MIQQPAYDRDDQLKLIQTVRHLLSLPPLREAVVTRCQARDVKLPDPRVLR